MTGYGTGPDAEAGPHSPNSLQPGKPRAYRNLRIDSLRMTALSVLSKKSGQKEHTGPDVACPAQRPDAERRTHVLQRNSAPSLMGKLMALGTTEEKQSQGEASTVVVQRQLP